jgi:imidazole glycerol-phosphate synthase subunit HisH
VKRVAILDHGPGSGDLRAVGEALARHGVEAAITSGFAAAVEADGLLVPGVGTYADCMKGLRAVRGGRIIGRRLAGARPVFGVCVGMQVLFERGLDEQGTETEGCGEWPGTVEPLLAPVLPHSGWSALDLPSGGVMFAGLPDDAQFFFGHSFFGHSHFGHTHAARDWRLTDTGPLPTPKVAWCRYGERPFVAAVENGALWAVQFHPERSADAGATLLANWVSTL